ncbi:MAG: hypothetical protein FWE67_11385 [Planctomycetaceae bacterium]|nr:hypothetical protein [Planctomycetaceae bacterium]
MKLTAVCRLLSAVFFCTAVCSLSGCGGPEKPKDFPKLYSCNIGITQNGAPVEGVQVVLYDPEVNSRWAVGGITDRSGNAAVRTHGQFVGAPAGKYKIFLTKTIYEGQGWDNPESDTRKWVEDIKTYSLIDAQYTDREKSPLELTIENKSVKKVFEIGEPVKTLIYTQTKDSR